MCHAVHHGNLKIDPRTYLNHEFSSFKSLFEKFLGHKRGQGDTATYIAVVPMPHRK